MIKIHSHMSCYRESGYNFAVGDCFKYKKSDHVFMVVAMMLNSSSCPQVERGFFAVNLNTGIVSDWAYEDNAFKRVDAELTVTD